jgi:hypothetical protein
MHTKEFTDPDEAMAFVKTLQENNCIDVVKTDDGTFRINWVENKMYTAIDGKEYVDEVWTKEDGTMIVCQDLELEHAKNIIRMIMRNDRERRKIEQEMMAEMQQAIKLLAADEGEDEEGNDLPPWMTDAPEGERVLH